MPAKAAQADLCACSPREQGLTSVLRTAESN